MRKCTVLMLITCLVASSLIAHDVTSTNVQAASKPSVPQFSLKLIDNSYDVPPSSTTDSYTGVTTTQPGYRVDNRSIEVTIKNQAFKPYTNADDYECKLYYDVHVKGHFGDDAEWQSFFYSYGIGAYGGDYRYRGFAQSDSSYTTVVSIINYPVGSLLDFRVEAFIGYWVPPTQGDHLMGMHSLKIVRDESSGYSNIQVITLTSGSSSLMPSQTATWSPVTSDGETQPPDIIFTNPLFTFGVGALFAGVVIAVVLVILRRYIKTPTYANDPLHTTSDEV